MKSENCIFCKIIRGEINSPRILEDDKFVCIRDIQPQARIHFLVFPKTHVESLAAFDLTDISREKMMGEMFEFISKVVAKEGLLPNGFRSVINTNKDAGQTVPHLHLHILAGEVLSGSFA